MSRTFLRRSLPAAAALPVLALQPSCVVVGGYSDEGGFWLWPGSILITAVAVAVIFLLARRRR